MHSSADLTVERAAAPLTLPPSLVPLPRLRAWALGPRGLPVVMAVATFVVFLPALWNGFVEWDDAVNLSNNPEYRGLGPRQLRWMFTTLLMGHWIPLTWLTFSLDYIVWGMNPFGYHLTSVLIHAANAGLFYLVALRLLGKATGLAGGPLRTAAASAALFFAVHPLRAESVAWVTERRDVLSGLFFMLSLLAYLAMAEAEGDRRRRLLAVSVGWYILALMSKSMVMTLPLALVLLDVYPLRRLPSSPARWKWPAVAPVVVEKLPYLLPALGAAAISLYAQSAANPFLTPLEKYPVSARIGMAFYSLWFYLAKTVLPIGLSPLYELPVRVDPLAPRFLAPALAVIAISAAAVVLRRRCPALLAAWTYYGIVLTPVVGIIHSGHQLTHDRYSYLAGLGWALLAGAGAAFLVTKRGAVRPALGRLSVVAVAVGFVGLGTLAWNQTQIWRDTETLWQYALDSDSECSICQGNLGVHYYNRKLFVPAKERFERFLELRPDRVKGHHNMGLALTALGRLPEAVEHFQVVLARHPDDIAVRNNLAVALIDLGRYAEALQHLETADRVAPRQAPIHTNFGVVLSELGRRDAALRHFRQAIELEPNSPQPRVGLARLHLALGQYQAALEQYEVLRTLDPVVAQRLAPALIVHW